MLAHNVKESGWFIMITQDLINDVMLFQTYLHVLINFACNHSPCQLFSRVSQIALCKYIVIFQSKSDILD